MTNEELLADAREFARHDNPRRLGTPTHGVLSPPMSGWWFVPRAIGTAVDGTWRVVGDARVRPAADVSNAFMLQGCFQLRSTFDLALPFSLELVAVRDDDSSVSRVLLFENDARLRVAIKEPILRPALTEELLLAIRERVASWEIVKPKAVSRADIELADCVIERLHEFELVWRRDCRFRIGHSSTKRSIHVAACHDSDGECFRFALEDAQAPSLCPWKSVVLEGEVHDQDKLIQAVREWLLRGGLPEPRGSS